MIVDSTDKIVSNSILTIGTWEKPNVQLITSFIKKGDKVINFGSQVGMEAIIMGKIIGSTGKLFIAEPYSISHQIVKKNVFLNGLNNYTTIYNYGVSNMTGKGSIHLDPYNTGGSLIFNSEINKENYETIKIDLADNLLPKLAFDFALIDV
jgi:FkbM family methyltransferase